MSLGRVKKTYYGDVIHQLTQEYQVDQNPIGDWLKNLVEDTTAPEEMSPEKIAQKYECKRQ